MKTEIPIKFWSSYRAKDLEVVADFITRSTQLQADCLERIKTSIPDHSMNRQPTATRSGSGADDWRQPRQSNSQNVKRNTKGDTCEN